MNVFIKESAEWSDMEQIISKARDVEMANADIQIHVEIEILHPERIYRSSAESGRDLGGKG